jgi:hypothetical protein
MHFALVLKQFVNIVTTSLKRLRWSRVSVLAFGTQVRGFAPGRNRRNYRAKKNPQHAFGGEVKPSVPCRSFTACKRSLNVMWKSTFRQNFRTFLAPRFRLPPLGALEWWHAWRRLVAKVGTSNPDRTISLKAAVRKLKIIIIPLLLREWGFDHMSTLISPSPKDCSWCCSKLVTGVF